jgi:hypothetical protein
MRTAQAQSLTDAGREPSKPTPLLKNWQLSRRLHRTRPRLPFRSPTSGQQRKQGRSAVERIAAFASAARPAHLTPDIRQLYKRNMLDSIGCAIAALPGLP